MGSFSYVLKWPLHLICCAVHSHVLLFQSRLSWFIRFRSYWRSSDALLARHIGTAVIDAYVGATRVRGYRSFARLDLVQVGFAMLCRTPLVLDIHETEVY